MKKKQISRNVKRRLTFFGPIITVILLFSVASITSYGYSIYSLKQEENELKEQLTKLKEEEELLTDEIAKLKDPEYIAKYARENYFYTKDGEYVIKIDEQEKKEEVKIKEDNSKMYSIISLVILVLLVLVTLLRRKNKKDNA